ncbi:hypothetical protein [Halorubrum sp. AJ67]|uniref:hypothetical protein n=1 Tax=Halorubrum sp. AJ67 TaxID=1173487 RepID=UPI0003DBC287|nr:hypothetical protein [Halorubrum sp. AJ67]CDK38905.1 uncharacterized protein BN903_199 [Halorubrum sp. AJ67]
MEDTHTEDKECTEQQILRRLPGFHLDSGSPCTCGVDAIRTSKSVGYSDFVAYTHSCTECGNEFVTYIEG